MQLVLPLPPLSLRAQSSTSASDEARLLERARSGEVAALDALMNAHRSRVLNLCFQVLRDETEAEDCAQDAFVRAFSGLASFKGRSSFGTWLYRVALNVCLERKRARRDFEELDQNEKAPDPKTDERLALEWALCALAAIFTFSNGRGLWDETPFSISLMAPLLAVSLLVALGLEAWRAWNTRRPRAKIERIERTRRERVSFFCALARSSAGVLAVVWSLLFFLGALSIWPIRAKLNRQIERRLQIGERAWLAQQPR